MEFHKIFTDFDFYRAASQGILAHFTLACFRRIFGKSLTALELQGTICAMKGGGV